MKGGVIFMNYEEKKKWVDGVVNFLANPDENDMDSWIREFTEFKKKLLKDQDFFKTNRGKDELDENLKLKPYYDFVLDLKFKRGRITSKNYYENLGNLRASYRTYLKSRN